MTWTKEGVFPYLFHGFSEKWLYYVLNEGGSKFYQWDGNDWGNGKGTSLSISHPF